MNSLESGISTIFKTLTSRDNPTLFIFISLFTTLYGGLAGPELPQVFKDLFQEDWFKMVVLSLIAYGASSDPQTAIMSAVLFMIIMNNLNSLSF